MVVLVPCVRDLHATPPVAFWSCCMFDLLRIVDALGDAAPGAVAVRVRVVAGRGQAVEGARVVLELRRLGEGAGVLPAEAQAAVDRLAEYGAPGRALRLDWLDGGGRPVPSQGRPTFFRFISTSTEEDEDMRTATAERTQSPVIDQDLSDNPLTAANLDAGRKATGDGLVGPLLVALDRAQSQALQASREGQTFAAQMARDSLRALTDQSHAFRALAVANGGRDAALIKSTIDAERRAAEAEAGVALAEAGTEGASELGQLVELVKTFRAGSPNPATILPTLLRKLHTDQGKAALAKAWANLSEGERAKVAEAIGGIVAGG